MSDPEDSGCSYPCTMCDLGDYDPTIDEVDEGEDILIGEGNG